jgi:FkbM family methyltransferase
VAGFLSILRDRASMRLFRVARGLATDFGWTRTTYQFGRPNIYGALLALKERGVSPRFAIDGGACKGDWTRVFTAIYPQCKVLLIEPQTRHRATLATFSESSPDRLRFSPSLLGPPGLDTTPFTVMDDTYGGTGSSVLPENSDMPRHVEPMPVTTLDRLLEMLSLPPPDFIKLDVQGYELEVLKGATRALAAAEIVLLEVSTWEYNQGAPLVAEVLAWMDAAGFRAYDVVDLRRRGDAVLLQLDVVFVSKRSRLVGDPMTRFGAPR